MNVSISEAVDHAQETQFVPSQPLLTDDLRKSDSFETERVSQTQTITATRNASMCYDRYHLSLHLLYATQGWLDRAGPSNAENVPYQ